MVFHSELASIPEDVIPESGGKLHLKLEPFRSMQNENFGLVRNTFRIGKWMMILHHWNFKPSSPPP